jgi:MtN3 and saliva related transmembrane protein
MDYAKIMGLSAAVLITVANFPQTYQIIKTKSTKDISGITYVLLFFGNASWLGYGLLQKDLPLIIGNCISTTTCLLIMVMKYTATDDLVEIMHEKIIPESVKQEIAEEQCKNLKKNN